MGWGWGGWSGCLPTLKIPLPAGVAYVVLWNPRSDFFQDQLQNFATKHSCFPICTWIVESSGKSWEWSIWRFTALASTLRFGARWTEDHQTMGMPGALYRSRGRILGCAGCRRPTSHPLGLWTSLWEGRPQSAPHSGTETRIPPYPPRRENRSLEEGAQGY